MQHTCGNGRACIWTNCGGLAGQHSGLSDAEKKLPENPTPKQRLDAAFTKPAVPDLPRIPNPYPLRSDRWHQHEREELARRFRTTNPNLPAGAYTEFPPGNDKERQA